MAKKKAAEPLDRFTLSDWFRWMERRRVKLQPVVGPKGVDYWAAGFVTVASSGQNVVNTCASGWTPLDALRALLRGDYWIKAGKVLRDADPRKVES